MIPVYTQRQVDALLAQVERTTVERERAAFWNGAVYGEVASCMHGVGEFPRKAHDEAARRFPLPARDAEMVAAVDRNAERIRGYGGEYGIPSQDGAA